MTDKGSKKPASSSVNSSADRARKLEDVTDLDHLDNLDEVPTTNVYTRTGKAAPTEVLPSAPKADKTEQRKPVDITVDRVDEPGAKAVTSSAADTAAEPVAASTVSTAGALHTTEGAENLASESAALKADTAGEPQPPIGRGTIDVGLLILRLVLGGVLILTSIAVLFQLGGNAGLAGLEDELASYNYPRALAIALPTMGLASGVFLVLGLLTPIASLVAVAATGFTAIETITSSEATSDIFAWEPSVWLAVALAGMALAVQFTGPGIFGIDFGRSWTRRPMVSSWLCAAIGIAAAVLLWVFA
ncbi:Uncharacterized membrane protein YphA, DoxX/SURF4 family [Corynebacterium appendicis CIP 107643]|uniref:Uncharacterized membrane protein YphA, DoxX/SURF4 family n=1 Tax=Corynebacterium appendicis CIP 107643 TaxID=1161099 RepID=A0A1N7IU48_9CORY|nr:DoxX family protein [Corynebacterium appendicis]WJY60955.1 DoxX [Corynebacterium appendicis CIP 107643]SIS40612.1 Uncharacterized membrane protein YphA, DoxX/SURF4 family [Corynebacterium appendicis CIP 107643]